MFRATFLGHQGWMFSAGARCVLVDPLLDDTFGHGLPVGRVFPPRRVRLDAMPPVAAVVLTHEHEDHLHLPSLCRLPRGTPVFLSCRSSDAARDALAGAGLRVDLLEPGVELSLAGLRVLPFAPDHDVADHADEWDVLPLLVRDARGHGSFFTAVDLTLGPATEARLRAALDAPPGLWAWAQNALDLGLQRAGPAPAPRPVDTAAWAEATLAEHARRVASWGTPGASLVVGGGWCFDGPRAWLNRHAFRVDTARACEALTALCDGHRFVAPRPGDTAVMARGVVRALDAPCPAVRPLPRRAWPSRAWSPGPALLDDWAPATGRTEADDATLDALAEALDDFARHLYASDLFRALYALDRDALGGRRPTVALVARTGSDGGACAWEYRPQSCAFVPSDSDAPARDHVAGFECWATDLLGLLRGDFGPSALLFGRSRWWSALASPALDLGHALWTYAHPLRRPAQYRALYRRMITPRP